jgi:hypothetical protein
VSGIARTHYVTLVSIQVALFNEIYKDGGGKKGKKGKKKR